MKIPPSSRLSPAWPHSQEGAYYQGLRADVIVADDLRALFTPQSQDMGILKLAKISFILASIRPGPLATKRLIAYGDQSPKCGPVTPAEVASIFSFVSLPVE